MYYARDNNIIYSYCCRLHSIIESEWIPKLAGRKRSYTYANWVTGMAPEAGGKGAGHDEDA